MSQQLMTEMQRAQANMMITEFTRQAVTLAVALSAAQGPTVAASMVANCFMAAGVGCLRTMALNSGGTIDPDAVRQTIENLLADPGTFVPPDGSRPDTKHFNLRSDP